MTNYYDIIRKNIKKYRKEKNLTQSKLAELVGLSQDYICEIESKSKHKSFSIDALGRIADTLDVNIKNFFDE